jgi:NAD(P)-dependent dehydrogenase (short-subunit alcohol dehydrogenase family)
MRSAMTSSSRLADRGDEVVITSCDATRAAAVAKEISASARGIALDLAHPKTIADAFDEALAQAASGKP